MKEELQAWKSVMHSPCAFLLAIMIIINIEFMGCEMNCCSRELAYSEQEQMSLLVFQNFEG